MRIPLNSVFVTVIIIAVCDCEWVNLVLFFFYYKILKFAVIFLISGLNQAQIG